MEIKQQLPDPLSTAKKSHFTGLIIIPFFLMATTGYSQHETDVLQLRNATWLYHSDISNSLYHHLAGDAFMLLEKRQENISAINSVSGWKERQAVIMGKLMEAIGSFPEKNELNAQITGVIEKEDYRIEHIVYESQPGFFVTSSLYIPGEAVNKRLPAIIYCSGHTAEGYRSRVYQHTIINLVKKGFIVLAFDPVGQGERLEYYDRSTGRSAIGGPTSEHSYAGAQAFITGSSQIKHMIWDGIRAVDLLLSRKEVDPGRIGITGRSGGGTQAAFISAMDDRIYAAAPEAYITSFKRLLQSIGPQDAEQNLYHGIMHGLDHADLLAVRAPLPALIISTLNDFFSIHGARETFREVRSIYEAYGKPYNIDMAEDLEGHATTVKNREAMYAFFRQHLNNPGSHLDIEVDIPDPGELRVTPTGQVSTSYESETVFSINRSYFGHLEQYLSELSVNLHLNRDIIIGSAKKLSGYRDPGMPDIPVYTGRIERNGYKIEKYFVRGEGNYVIPFVLMVPDYPGDRSVIYLDPEGKAAGARQGGTAEWLVNRGFTVLLPDLIGTGETGPGYFRGDSHIDDISYNVWFTSVLTGRSIAGIRAADVVKLSWLLRDHFEMKEVLALARAEMTSELLHAAAFDPLISRVALLEPLTSYGSLVSAKFYQARFIHGAVPGMLRHYDLPFLAASLAPRRLLVANPVDGEGNRHGENTHKDLSVIQSAYIKYEKPGHLIFEPGLKLEEKLLRWIE
jgi:cephalosporin-C deacetylase-like acetyl esterase